MKKQEISTPLVMVAAIACFLAIIFSSVLIKGAKKTNVAAVPVVPASFPDVKNNTRFNSFLNTGSLDPTQAVPIGNSQNNSPFKNAP